VRYRALDASGDYVLGGGISAFFVNTPDAVAQAVRTRLNLWQAEWFLDTTDGTAWPTGVLGRNTEATRDAVIRNRILTTPGVNVILSYSSSLDRATRTFNVSVSLDTIYGAVAVQNVPLPIAGIANTTGGTTSSPLNVTVPQVSQNSPREFSIGIGRMGVDYI
jgi:hypothetical protein